MAASDSRARAERKERIYEDELPWRDENGREVTEEELFGDPNVASVIRDYRRPESIPIFAATAPDAYRAASRRERESQHTVDASDREARLASVLASRGDLEAQRAAEVQAKREAFGREQTELARLAFPALRRTMAAQAFADRYRDRPGAWWQDPEFQGYPAEMQATAADAMKSMGRPSPEQRAEATRSLVDKLRLVDAVSGHRYQPGGR